MPTDGTSPCEMIASGCSEPTGCAFVIPTDSVIFGDAVRRIVLGDCDEDPEDRRQGKGLALGKLVLPLDQGCSFFS